MAIVNKRLTTTQLDAITVPSGKTFAITNVLVCNNTTTDCVRILSTTHGDLT